MHSIKTLSNNSIIGTEFDPIPITKQPDPVRTRSEIIGTVSSLGQKFFSCIKLVTDEELEAEFSDSDLSLDFDVSPQNITDKDLENEFGIDLKEELDQNLRGLTQRSNNKPIQGTQKDSASVNSELVTDEELEAEFSDSDLSLDFDVSPQNITDKDLENEFGIDLKEELDQNLRELTQRSNNKPIQGTQKDSASVNSELVNRFARLRGVDSTTDPISKILSRPAPDIESRRPMIHQVRALNPNIQETVGRSVPLPLIPEKSLWDRIISAIWG